VVPDILAEALVLRALAPDRCSPAQQEAIILRAARLRASRVVPFVLRTVQDFAAAGQAAPLDWLEALIQSGLADDSRPLIRDRLRDAEADTGPCAKRPPKSPNF